MKVVFTDPKLVYIHGGEPIPPAQFARVEVTIGGLSEQQRRELARRVCGLLCDAGAHGGDWRGSGAGLGSMSSHAGHAQTARRGLTLSERG